MPTYTYACPSCGTFDLLRTVSLRDEPAQCPGCTQPGSRVFTPPHLSGLSSSLDRAVTTAGLSSESPQVTRNIPAAAGTRQVATQRSGYPALPRP